MVEILKLYFDSQKKDELLILYTTAQSLEQSGNLSEFKIFYESNIDSKMIAWDYFQELPRMLVILKSALDQKLLLHESIVKNIGYYWNRYLKKTDRKDLVYKENEHGAFWVGGIYKLFDFTIIDCWLYNDKQGNIVFEMTPTYPWFFSAPKPDETFIKYSEWMKTYEPYLKRIISKEVAEKWLIELQELTNIVQKISKTLPCGGMLDCGGCIHLGKQND